MAEVIYGTSEEGHVMSEKVQSLAASVYKEFERMIKRYDEDVVKELMPLVVGILESLDGSYAEKQECEVEGELLRDDNEQLLTQYEREKQLRRSAEQKYMELEDAVEAEKCDLENKVESLESITRMLELKSRNAGDHVSRLEDKETEMKREYQKLHERYTELFKSHMDYMDRAKILMGTDRISELANSPRNRTFHLPSLKPINSIYGGAGESPLKATHSPISNFDITSPASQGHDSNVSLRSELQDLETPSSEILSPDSKDAFAEKDFRTTSEKGQITDSIDVRETSTGTGTGTKSSPPVTDNQHPTPTNQEQVLKQTDQSTSVLQVNDTVTTNVSRVSSSSQSTVVNSESHISMTNNIADSEHTHKQLDHKETTQTLPNRTNAFYKDLSETISLQRPESEIVTESIPIPVSNNKNHQVDHSDSIVQRRMKTAERTEHALQVDITPPVRIISVDSDTLIEGSFDAERLGVGQSMMTPDLDDFDEMNNKRISRPREDNSGKFAIGMTGSVIGINNESIFDELTPDGLGDVDFGADITGKEVYPGDYASSDEDVEKKPVSDNFFGMGKEVENLILENTELLATKNALNIVKDDLIAKVDELTSEQEILREEITSLQAVKGRLQLRITQLEEDLKKTKEELDKKSQGGQGEDVEDEVPMAQRKRFTRVEMARVLMERNQYKERLMELQEAVRWTEMVRASREHPDLMPKKKSSIWSFFGNLFSSSNKTPTRRPGPHATVKYSAPTNVRPVGDPNKNSRDAYNLGEKSKAYDFLQEDIKSSEPPGSEEKSSEPPGSEEKNEKTRKERERSRREQYKQVRAHVKKDNGRMQAYGWSLPAKFQSMIPQKDQSKGLNVPVPVPVYCRPLLESEPEEPGLKVWCAAGVNLTGGHTKDGGAIVGASVFYSVADQEGSPQKGSPKDEIEKLNQELKEHEKNVKNQEQEQEQLSSLAWICTSTAAYSRITVIDINNPGDILESFQVASSHILSIASVPGALESDYPVTEDVLKPTDPNVQQATAENLDVEDPEQENTGIGGITFVQCATGAASPGGSQEATPTSSPHISRDSSPDRNGNIYRTSTASEDNKQSENSRASSYDNVSVNSAKEESPESQFQGGYADQDDTKVPTKQSTSSPPEEVPPATTPSQPSAGTPCDKTRVLVPPNELVKDGTSCPSSSSPLQMNELEKLSSVLPTMWMGCQSGSLLVHSAVSEWRKRLHYVKLRDAILCIVHVKGRVLAGLANGTIAIFHRAPDAQWDLLNYHVLDLGRPQQSIRCMVVMARKHVWCGYKNVIHVIEPSSMVIAKSFDAHPRKESQVRQLAWIGDGVWVSIRLDSTLRLYHAYTYEHLQDVDIEPYVSKMLGTGKLGFSFVRITTMLIASKRLWIGTGNGVIISVPLSECNKQQIASGIATGRPGSVVRVYSDTRSDSVTPGTFIPYCSMAQAQLSFHGHRDAVKFFVSVPGLPSRGLSAASASETSPPSSPKSRLEATPAPASKLQLIASGGEGYIDFRVGDGDEDDNIQGDDQEKNDPMSRSDMSHLIVWQVQNSE